MDGQIKVGDFGLVKDMDDAFDLEMMKKGHSPAYRGHTIEVGMFFFFYLSVEQFVLTGNIFRNTTIYEPRAVSKSYLRLQSRYLFIGFNIF